MIVARLFLETAHLNRQYHQQHRLSIPRRYSPCSSLRARFALHFL